MKPNTRPSTSDSSQKSKINSDVLRVIDVLNKKLNSKAIDDVLTNVNQLSLFKDDGDGKENDEDKSNQNRKIVFKDVEVNTEPELYPTQESSQLKPIQDQEQCCCCCCKKHHRHGFNCTTKYKIENEKFITHEFVISVHKVSDFPLFTRDYDMDCFVDYKFPHLNQIDGKLSMNTTPYATETTIALRSTHFTTAHTHLLRLKKGLTESLVIVQKPDLVFRLWGRTYHPVPRDHKLAKARLPLTKLTFMEFKHEQEVRDGSFFKQRLKIPLELIRSSLTSGICGQSEVGYMILEISYRKYKMVKNENQERIFEERQNKHIRIVDDDIKCDKVMKECDDDFQLLQDYNKYKKKLISSRPPIPRHISQSTAANLHNSLKLCELNNENLNKMSPLSEENPIYLKNDTNFQHPYLNSFPTKDYNNKHSPILFDSSPIDDDFHETTVQADIHHSPLMFSSQDPLQLRNKDFVSDAKLRLSEEFEIISHPSFLAETSPPRIERDFPPDIMTNFDINTSAINTPAENPFELNCITMGKDKKDLQENLNFYNEPLPPSPPPAPMAAAQPPPRPSNSVAIETDSQESEHKGTQTLLNHNDDATTISTDNLSDDEWFTARIIIERAINLSTIVDDDNQTIKPSTFVQFKAKSGDEIKFIRTNIVNKSTSPVWNASWEIQLPTRYLYKINEDFELFIYAVDKSEPLGKIYVDLTAVTAGLPCIDGWYSINDGINCSGQVKVTVTPLEDISRFKEMWLQEYSKKDLLKDTRTSLRKLNTKSTGSGNMTGQTRTLSETLRQKITAMNQITKEIKNKISKDPELSNTPPYSLLGKANNYLTTLEETDNLIANWKKCRENQLIERKLENSNTVNNDDVNIVKEDVDIIDLNEIGNNNINVIKSKNKLQKSPPTSLIILSDDGDDDLSQPAVPSFNDIDDLIVLDSPNYCKTKTPLLIDLTEDPGNCSQGTLNRQQTTENKKKN